MKSISSYKQLPIYCTFWNTAWTNLKKNKGALIGSYLLFFLLFLAIIGPFLTRYTYYDNHLTLINIPPSLKFWFGTDELGRDLFTRTCWGTRISLIMGISAAIIDLIIGVIWGTIAALSEGIIDEIMMRFCDILSSLPYLLVVILLTVVLGPGMITLLIAITCIGWINMARIVRAQIYHLKNREYVTAAKVLGASSFRIIVSHLLPNSFGPIFATMTLTIPIAIFTEAFLSFLGLGIQAPIASLGVMVNDSISALRYYPWRLFFPASMIFFTMLSFNLLSDGMRDALDPGLKR